MTDELGEHFRVSTLMIFTAGLLSAVIVVLVFSLINFRSYTGRYTNAMEMSAVTSIVDLQAERFVTCPQAYASIIEAGGEVRTVTYVDKDGNARELFNYRTVGDDLVWLISAKQSRTNVRVIVNKSTDNISPLYLITLTYDERTNP